MADCEGPSWDEFLKHVSAQIQMYDRYATINRTLHIISRLWAAIGAIVAPVLLSLSNVGWAHSVGIAASTSVAIALAADRIYAWGDRYRNCRLAWNNLKFEKVAYVNGCGDYAICNDEVVSARTLFFNRVRNIIDHEISARVEALLTAETPIATRVS